MVNLSKGGKVNLSKETGGSKKFEARLYWDANAFDGGDFDLDAMAVICDGGLKALSPQDNNFVFYNNLQSPCGGVSHSGDNLTGEGDGADETITFDLTKINGEARTVAILVNIHEAQSRNQNFGMVRNSKIDIFDVENNKVVAEYWLEDDFSSETCVVFGELTSRDGQNWNFSAVGSGKSEGLGQVLSVYGIQAQ